MSSINESTLRGSRAKGTTEKKTAKIQKLFRKLCFSFCLEQTTQIQIGKNENKSKQAFSKPKLVLDKAVEIPVFWLCSDNGELC